MGKIPPEGYFYKSFKHLLTGKLTAREVLIFAIIYEFETNTGQCFISRAELAHRINESEATAERSLQVLIKEGYVRSTRDGRKRYLHTVDLYQVDTGEAPNLYQNEEVSVSKQGSDLYQVDTLIRLTNNITNKIKNKINNKINITSDIGGSMKGETDAEKARRLHLKSLWDDPTGWHDDGNALTKWDDTYQTLLRKPKSVHADKSWNGKADYSDLPE